jgi:macrophage erythroblast attacher
MGQNISLEYELRLQQFIELVRAGFTTGETKKFQDARAHAVKYLSSHPDDKWKAQAATLLAIQPDTQFDPYDVGLFPTLA